MPTKEKLVLRQALTELVASWKQHIELAEWKQSPGYEASEIRKIERQTPGALGVRKDLTRALNYRIVAAGVEERTMKNVVAELERLLKTHDTD